MQGTHHATPLFRLLICSLAIALTAGCGSEEQAQEASQAAAEAAARSTPMEGLSAADDLGPPHLLAFACGETEPYLAIHDPASDTVRLYTPAGDVHTLAHEVAASGARYSDGQVMLWAKGQDQVLLEIDGRPVSDCGPSGRQRVLTAAFQAGFWLRASGNEPGWTLQASPQSIRLNQMGSPAASFAGLQPGDLESGRVLERTAGPHRLRVTVEEDLCQDTMSGEPSPLSVVVELDDETLRGCGLWLRKKTASP